MKIRNLTPHPITVNGCEYLPEGICPRIGEVREAPIQLTDIRIERIFTGGIIGLPAPDGGSLLLVSREVAKEAHRPDVVCPCDYIRDDKGRIVGAGAVAWFPPPEISMEVMLSDDHAN